MIHNVLVVSRADEGRLAAEIEHVDLAEVARLGVAAFSTAAAVEEHPLRAEAPEPARVPADLDLTRRILENLLRNALRHTPRGTSIVVRARPLGPERGELSVADDGPGIPPEVPPHLFERYGGAELRRRGIRVDPGLGLAFCRAAAEVMGAGISVESDGRRGTEFRLRFPAIRD
jgi:signal transduction histidine kinase